MKNAKFCLKLKNNIMIRKINGKLFTKYILSI